MTQPRSVEILQVSESAFRLSSYFDIEGFEIFPSPISGFKEKFIMKAYLKWQIWKKNVFNIKFWWTRRLDVKIMLTPRKLWVGNTMTDARAADRVHSEQISDSVFKY